MVDDFRGFDHSEAMAYLLKVYRRLPHRIYPTANFVFVEQEGGGTLVDSNIIKIGIRPCLQ
ncbi:hypothetical protein CRP01_33080 [Flavilitoribacter nigricans DSM 23189 = NBRC 102662]|uniref:Uncharacterized protein n=1 Tax=Flavilitoribacter nigricans (strain ATCC 23147 / DSM 23189 / NBRC 102662 / NCIMB 1420 / SS-2) TaxID=1122177 RepID=A0A2D0N0U6_FLAN2|nr:hypothetical protein CRP01_33080 [Flavilitoribacter nigricans DSM 23189 = NBRC 102662]